MTEFSSNYPVFTSSRSPLPSCQPWTDVH